LLEKLARDANDRRFAPCYDDASSVGCRLAALLPLPLTERQSLLEIADPIARLERLHGLLAFKA
jgi:uncharacterized protein